MSRYFYPELAFAPTETGLKDITGIKPELRDGEPERIEGVRIPPHRVRAHFEPVKVVGERISDRIIRERR